MPPTDIACRNAKAADRPYKLADGGGLHLLFKSNGGRYWRMKYRYGGEKKLSFGVCSEVTLSDARNKRKKAHKLRDAGTDPAADRVEKNCIAVDKAAHGIITRLSRRKCSGCRRSPTGRRFWRAGACRHA